MRADEGLPSADVGAVRSTRGVRLGGNLATWAFWLLGSVVVTLAQPTTDRGLAAVGAAVAGVATILVVQRLTADPGRRYFRSVVGTVIAVSLSGDWLVQRLNGNANGFVAYGLDTRIAIPLIFVLLTPLVLRALPTRLRSRALWHDRAHIWREAAPLDWVAAAYALLIVPGLLLGFAHHSPKTYVAQDFGLAIFFVFAYIAGRTVGARAGRDSALEFVVVLLLLALGQVFLNWDTTPMFTFVEAVCVGAVGFALLKPTKARLLLLVPAVALLVHDAVAVKQGSASTTAIELAAALGLIAYLAVRSRHLAPQWLVLGIALAALAGFLAFTSDGAGVIGRYHGTDPSKWGRTFEADQVRAAIHSSHVSFVLGRGLGGSINETQAPKLFAESLAFGGRDLSHVPAVHLLPYEFLLKFGLVGFAWLAAFVLGVAILGLRALETASRQRDPTPVVYAALPLLGIVAALAAATHLQDNPLNAFAVGVLVTRFEGGRSSRRRVGLALTAAAVLSALVGAVAFTKPPPFATTKAPPELLNLPLPGSARVGDLRLNYPGRYKRTYFGKPGRAHGVVLTTYPPGPSPQIGGASQHFRADGVFFEVYEIPRKRPLPTPPKKLPLTIFDLTDTVKALRNAPPSTEQGGAYFRAKDHNYRVILWVGAKVPSVATLEVDELVNAIRVK